MNSTKNSSNHLGHFISEITEAVRFIVGTWYSTESKTKFKFTRGENNFCCILSNAQLGITDISGVPYQIIEAERGLCLEMDKKVFNLEILKYPRQRLHIKAPDDSLIILHRLWEDAD